MLHKLCTLEINPIFNKSQIHGNCGCARSISLNDLSVPILDVAPVTMATGAIVT